MRAVNIVTGVCVALLTLAVIYVIAEIARKKRPERIAFLRNFKKGKCLAVFVIAVPLLCMGYFYESGEVLKSILNAVTHTVELVVLKFGISKVGALMADNPFYSGAVYYCCLLVAVNAVMFTLSLIGQRLWLFGRRVSMRYMKKEKLLIFGYNKGSLSVYKSDAARSKVIIDKIPSDDCKAMYATKTNYISCTSLEKAAASIFVDIYRRNAVYTVVVNTEDDEKNLCLCRVFADGITSADEEKRRLLFDKLRIYVFGDPKYEAVYAGVAADGLGCIRYKNKYQMVAMNFVDQYPFTKFMDERHIDYGSATVKSGVDINVCMIGFGKTNRQIFMTSVANNQFIEKTKKGVALKKVDYYIFDKTPAENNKNLNHSYYRYRNEIDTKRAGDYLPLPDFPANETYYRLDVNDNEFYIRMRDVVTKSDKDVDFVIIAFETDLENIDMAQKLVEKRAEWGVDDLVIFVKVRNPHEDFALFARKNVFAIGDWSRDAFDIDRITDDKIFRMAQMRNEVYDLEYKVAHVAGFVVDNNAVAQSRADAYKKWYTEKSQLERESNLYGCLSLQSKLNMIGLDYCDASAAAPALSEREYMDIYGAGDMPQVIDVGDVEGKKVIKYTLDFPQSLRRNLAELEHLRWNSFAISKGIVPADKHTILTETTEADGAVKYTNGRNYSVRRHGNLTTFDGLTEFRRMVAERDGKDEASCDVIKYDYQILDDAYWLLNKNGYKIVKKSPL